MYFGRGVKHLNIIDTKQVNEGVFAMGMAVAMSDAHAVRGDVHLEVKKNGIVIDVSDEHNVVVIGGRSVLAGLLGGRDSGKYITHVGVGTSSNAATENDTDLVGKVLIAVSGATYDGPKVRFNFTIGSSQANGMTIRELGLFFANGVMFSRKVRKSAIGKEDDIEITGYWDIYL